MAVWRANRVRREAAFVPELRNAARVSLAVELVIGGGAYPSEGPPQNEYSKPQASMVRVVEQIFSARSCVGQSSASIESRGADCAG